MLQHSAIAKGSSLEVFAGPDLT